MAAMKYPTTESNLCPNPENHRSHICTLKVRGLFEEVKERSDKPSFACFNCGARANEAGDLCSPTPLENFRTS